MNVYITQETSGYMSTQATVIYNIGNSLSVLENKFYGNDLKVIYIALFCIEDKYASFFKPRKNIYRKEAKMYLHKGVQFYTEEKTFIYELRLDYKKYSLLADIRESLVADILSSFDEILKCSKIKDFRFDEFIKDVKEILNEAKLV